jgi:hypothetical protein
MSGKWKRCSSRDPVHSIAASFAIFTTADIMRLSAGGSENPRRFTGNMEPVGRMTWRHILISGRTGEVGHSLT